MTAMTVDKLIEELQKLKELGLGDFKVTLSKYNDRPFGWEFFSLSDVGYSEKVVVISIEEN